MTTGIFIGKFLPPHRGHLTSIFTAYTMCDKLYVIICHREEYGIPGELRKQWLSQELQNFENIKIILVDESDIPGYPNGWNQFCDLVSIKIREHIDFIFGGESQDIQEYEKRFDSKYILIHPDHSAWPISGTLVRDNPNKYWDYIIGSARPYFVKKVLITGTESCGKTTLTKMLAKIYNTSWSEEVGRYYAQRYLGGDESIFTDEDFRRIAHLQYESDYDAMRHANRICFFDTDAVVTDYYSKLYLGHHNHDVLRFVDYANYDIVFMMTPSVKWVPDGQRFHGQEIQRWNLHNILLNTYNEVYGKKVHVIHGDYMERLSLIRNRLESSHGPNN